MKIVCISGKAQHGKDTTAGFLKEALEAEGQKVLVAHFADLLKYICKTFFEWDGQKDEHGRHILQYVGTDVIRAKSPDYWADFMVNFLSMFENEWDFVIIPDTRFPNEYEIFKHYGFDVKLVRVFRPDFVSPLTPEQQAHPSETSLDDYPYDYRILNTSLSDLKALVRAAARPWFIEGQSEFKSVYLSKPYRPLTILFDADDVAENLLNCWIGVLNRRYGTSVSIEDVTDWDVSKAFPTLTKEQIFDVLLEDELWQSLKPLPGAQRILEHWYKQGHQLYMVTASDYRTCKAKFERIFELFPFLDWDHIIVTSNKQMVRGDVLIDDGIHNLIDGDYYKILFTRPHNAWMDDLEKYDIHRADSWDDVDDLVHRYAESRGMNDCN